MTREEALASITPEMEEMARIAMLYEPDLTDPDAPEISDDAIAIWRAARPGRKNPGLKKSVVTMRLSPDVERALNSLGPNYTTRAEQMLRGALIGMGALPA